jgi:hypothetical protein
MKSFIKICGMMLWIGSVFALEAGVVHFSDRLIYPDTYSPRWAIACAILMFFDFASIITFVTKF